MTRFRSHWLALLGAAAIMSLSVSGALGHSPWGDTNRGQQVSAYVHGLVGGDEDSADADETEPAEETEDIDETTDQEEPSGHGACVSEVAHSDEVGGKNENHGGAVSLAARETCREGATDEPSDEEQVSDAEDSDDADQDEESEEDSEDDDHGQGNPKHDDDADDDD